jgi:MFS family permease
VVPENDDDVGRLSRGRTGARDRLVQLCAAGALAYCSYAMCRSPLLPLFARELGADASTIGLIVGASTLTGIVVKLPAGAWSDVVGRRALLVIGAMVFAVMPFMYLAVTGLGLQPLGPVTTAPTRTS